MSIEKYDLIPYTTLQNLMSKCLKRFIFHFTCRENETPTGVLVASHHW